MRDATAAPGRLLLAGLAAALALALCAPREASAFCGFYVAGSSEGLFNRATRVSLMRHRTRTVLAMSNDYDGPPEDFAMVVPVPVVLQRENVRTLPHAVFEHLEALTAPRLVEYWEQDPCPRRDVSRIGGMDVGASMALSARVGLEESESDRSRGVRVEARFSVGEYDVVVLSATQSGGLELWLREHRYRIPRGAASLLAPYIREGWKFFVARVDIERARRDPNGGARLSPLRFHYDDPQFRLPVRLGLLNARDAQDLIVYVIHPTSRFEVANYRNVFVPTNLDVAESVRGRFAGFYAQLFDATVASAGMRAVVTEYAWATNGCDPCPTPVLDPSELATLGADVLVVPDDADEAFDRGSSTHRVEPEPAFDANAMVVTRLHARYNAATLTEDLVFREARGVAGGREHIAGANREIEQGARPSEQNNFQARYVIRHPWTGPIECQNPRRGVWGGPPSGHEPDPIPARDVAAAPRGALDLRAAVLSRTPGVDLGARLALPAPPPLAAQGEGSGGAPPTRRGCACRAGTPSEGAETAGGRLAAAMAVAALAAGARRRRREGRA